MIKLTITQTNKKAGKFLYQVIDENGTVLSSRTSNREYVACTVNGAYYFGRADLIGKGDHGRAINDAKKYDKQSSLTTLSTIAYLENTTTITI